MTYGFGMLSLKCRVLTTISTCFNDLQCPGGFAMGNHRRATTPSTAETTTWGTILPMVSILSGRCLRRPYPSRVAINRATLQQCRKRLGRMWRGIWCASSLLENYAEHCNDVGIRNFVAADDMLCYPAQYDCRG